MEISVSIGVKFVTFELLPKIVFYLFDSFFLALRLEKRAKSVKNINFSTFRMAKNIKNDR